MTDKSTSTLLSTADVMARLQIGRTTLWEMQKRGEFPKPITLGKRCKRWRAHDIDAILERQSHS